MDYHIRLHATTAAIVITLGFTVSLVTSAVVVARAYSGRIEQAARQERTIVVTGSTRHRIRSDRAVWSIEVSGRGPALTDAFAVLDGGVRRVHAFLKEMGFGDGEIGIAAIDTHVHYVRDAKGNNTREIAEYTLQRRFVVTTHDVERVNQAAGRVTQLIEEGVHVISCPPEYYFTELAQLKIDLMAAASADAHSRAEKIAASTGARLGELRDARMGVLQITQPYSTKVASYGIYDTSTIDKDVRAVVSATFGISVD
jgi:hypothetical protein